MGIIAKPYRRDRQHQTPAGSSAAERGAMRKQGLSLTVVLIACCVFTAVLFLAQRIADRRVGTSAVPSMVIQLSDVSFCPPEECEKKKEALADRCAVEELRPGAKIPLTLLSGVTCLCTCPEPREPQPPSPPKSQPVAGEG